MVIDKKNSDKTKKRLVLGCGALVYDLLRLIKQNPSLSEKVNLQCLPASWHNSPQLIAPGVEDYLSENAHLYEDIYIASLKEANPNGEDLPSIPVFEKAEPILGDLNSRADDIQAALTRRGDHVFLSSNRDQGRLVCQLVHIGGADSHISLSLYPQSSVDCARWLSVLSIWLVKDLRYDQYLAFPSLIGIAGHMLTKIRRSAADLRRK